MNQNMKTLSSHYRTAIDAIRAATLAPDFEYRSALLSVYCRTAPAHRPDLQGRVYLEAFEKVPGGITHLNWWTPATPAGFREFFTGLAERTGTFVSARPYRFGQSCDGTIGSPVLAAFKVACDALGFDADALYKEAYSGRDDPLPDWARCRADADWQGGVVWPDQWDADAVAGVIESLTEINYHSLVSTLATHSETRLQGSPSRTKIPG